MGMTGVPAKLQKGDIIDAISHTNGLVRKAAKLLNVSHQTIYEYLYRDKDLRDHLEECRLEYQYQQSQRYWEEDNDLVEEAYKAMLALVKGKNVNAVMFVLKEKAGWDKGMKLQAQKQDQTLVFQVNNGQLEQVNDSNNDSIAILPKAIPKQDIEGSP